MPSRLTGWPSAIPILPASEPDIGIGVCSRVHGTSLTPPWFMPAWVASERGTLSHFAAGKVLQACVNLSPQMPAHERPDTRKIMRMSEM
ncbi:hypothetical protein D9M68_997370 [compost metagenome]